jgi:hypothetical protein
MTNRFAIAENFADEAPAEFREAVLSNLLLSFLIPDELKSTSEWTYRDLPSTIPRHHPELLKIIADLTTSNIEHNWKIIETTSEHYVVFLGNFYNDELYKVNGITSFSDELPAPPVSEVNHEFSEAQKLLLSNCHEALLAVVNEYTLSFSQQGVVNIHNQLKTLLDPEQWSASEIPNELPNVNSFTCMMNWLATTTAFKPVGPGLGFSVKGNVIASWAVRLYPGHKAVIEFLPDFTVKWSVSYANDLNEIRSTANGTELVSNLNRVLSGFKK